MISPDFQYAFESSHSTADLLTVVSERIAGDFNISGPSQTVALHMSNDSVSHAGLAYKLKHM